MVSEMRGETPENEDGNETLESIDSEPLVGAVPHAVLTYSQQQMSPTPAGPSGRHIAALDETASEMSDDDVRGGLFRRLADLIGRAVDR